MPEATTTAQKILSCVARTGERFGVGHVVAVLAGADTDAVRRWGHDQLSTHGLLSDMPRPALTNLVYQLIDQGVLEQRGDDRPILRLNEASWAVMRGQQEVKLLAPAPTRAARAAQADAASWEGVDRGLFEHLRGVRTELARERDVPAYIVFGDVTLRDLARLRPASPTTFRQARGVGERKAEDLGPRFLDEIAAYCAEHGLEQDVRSPAPMSLEPPVLQIRSVQSLAKDAAYTLFASGTPVPDVARQVDRAESTVWGYLAAWAAETRPDSLAPYVDDATVARIEAARAEQGAGHLGPLHRALDGEVPYEVLRVVVGWMVAGGN